MKIIWITNILPSFASSEFHIDETFIGGWLDYNGSRLIKENNYLTICFPSKQSIKMKKNNLEVISFSENSNNNHHFFKELFAEIQPDVIHIQGTEFKHSLIAARAANDLNLCSRLIVSIQGLVGLYSIHMFEGLSWKDYFFPTATEIVKNTSLLSIRNSFSKRGKYEVETIKLANKITGRTDWDYSFAFLNGRKDNYVHINETLRDVFYTDQWDYDSCVKHSIFASCGDTPIKGLHYLIQAARILVKKYPDLKIYVPIRTKKKIIQGRYMRRMTSLIKKNKLSDVFVFCGNLSKDEVKQKLLSSNVFVLCSNIENSPNSLGEATILGTPCVASDVGGVGNLLKHGVEGFVFSHTEYYMLAYYISELFDCPDLAKDFSKAAVQRCHSVYDRSNNYNNLISLYKSLK